MKDLESTDNARTRPRILDSRNWKFGLFLPLTLLVSITLLVAVAGPFGTYGTGGFWDRLVYWGVANTCALVMATVIREMVASLARRGSLLWSELTVILLMTLIFTPFLWVWTSYWLPDRVDEMPNMARLSMYVFGVCLMISALRQLVPVVIKARLVDENEAERPMLIPEPGLPRLSRRLPDGPVHNILRLTVDGHKVLVVTGCTTFEIRMRFADAVDEMDGVDGFCTHRSHWVTRASVVGVERSGAKMELLLINGDRVPVSRKYRPDVEAAGLF